MKVLLTRNKVDCERSAKILIERGYQPVILPLSKTVEIDNKIPKVDFDGLVFTSVKAITTFSKNLGKNQLNLPVYAVGPNTAHAAQNAGFTNVTEGEGDAGKLAKLLIDCFPTSPIRLLYPSGTIQAFDMRAALINTQIELMQVEVYATNYLDPGKQAVLDALKKATKGVQLHYSSASAGHFSDLVKLHGGQALSKTMNAVAISEKTALTIDKSLIRTLHIANVPTQNGMLSVLEKLI